MPEPRRKSYSYQGYELLCSAQPMADGVSYAASLIATRGEGPHSVETLVPLSATPFTDPDVAISHALLNGRHWVDALQ